MWLPRGYLAGQGRLLCKATRDGRFQTVGRVPLTDPDGYFDVRVRFPSSGFVQVAWASPHSPQIHSRTVQVAIR